jgi:hypothetical protein
MQDSLTQKVAQMEQKGVPRDDIIELLKLGASSVKHRTVDTDPLSSLMWNAGAALACLSAGVAMYFLTSDMDLALPDWCNAGRANENEEAEISVIMHYECKFRVMQSFYKVSNEDDELVIVHNQESERGIVPWSNKDAPPDWATEVHHSIHLHSFIHTKEIVVAENNDRNGR